MKKVVFIILALFAVVVSCTKSVKETLQYSITTVNSSYLDDVYVPHTGTYDMGVDVKFLTGNTTDQVRVSISGVPANITVTPDSMVGVPTYTVHFVFTSTNAAYGTYPVTITAYTPTSGTKTFTFNLIVIPADCVTALAGNLAVTNACTSANYAYTATVTSAGVANKMLIHNFGGYGPEAIATVMLNCTKDSLNIPSQKLGNAGTLTGYGVFTGNSMVIYYNITSTPGGFPDNCTATFTK